MTTARKSQAEKMILVSLAWEAMNKRRARFLLAPLQASGSFEKIEFDCAMHSAYLDDREDALMVVQ